MFVRLVIFGLLLLFISRSSFAQGHSYVLKVHCLYGSKPARKFKDSEEKWFGGKLGAHVGIESENGHILNFVPRGKFHVFGKKKNRHSAFVIHSVDGFYSIFGGNPDSVKKVIVHIPVTAHQKHIFDSLSLAYTETTPYDYAFFGMRCGAATYEILGRIGIVEPHSIQKTSRVIFYPRKLRKRLLKKARTNSWQIERVEGSKRRKWDSD